MGSKCHLLRGTQADPTPLQCAAGLGSLVGPVAVEVEKGRSNSRHLSAGVDIAAPVSTVWAALTDYDNLGVFIPGRIVNNPSE